jgi:hypothetical protein
VHHAKSVHLVKNVLRVKSVNHALLAKSVSQARSSR